VPEHYTQSHGKQAVKLDSSKPAEVTKFIKSLAEAISQDMTDIRETELDRAGGYEQVVLLDTEGGREAINAFVDRLSRVIIPIQPKPYEIHAVEFPRNGITPRKVVRTEIRHLGERPVAKVLYLEAEDTNV
jgi:hypothetical protein